MTLVWDRPERQIHSDRIFFTSMAVVSAAVVLAGFAPTYYFRSGSLPPLTLLYQLHGFLFTTWIGLFIAQTGLVASRRTDIHRQLGIAGVVLAAAVFVTGVVVSIETLRRTSLTPPATDGRPTPQQFLAIPLGDIIAFGLLVTAGVLLRRNTAAHKRLMLLATISLLAAGFGRGLVQLHLIAGPIFFPLFFLCTAVFVGMVAVYDFASRGHIHPATVWGGLAVAAFKPALFAFAATPLWTAFASVLR
jgi:hypothetical protein